MIICFNINNKIMTEQMPSLETLTDQSDEEKIQQEIDNLSSELKDKFELYSLLWKSAPKEEILKEVKAYDAITKLQEDAKLVAERLLGGRDTDRTPREALEVALNYIKTGIDSSGRSKIINTEKSQDSEHDIAA